MDVTVHTQHFALTPAIRRFALENLQLPLETMWKRGGMELHIFLRDLRGGDKQGVDKECRAVLQVPHGRKFVITEITDNMRTSIHQTRKRLLRRVRQYTGHQLETSRRHRKHYFAGLENAALP